MPSYCRSGAVDAVGMSLLLTDDTSGPAARDEAAPGHHLTLLLHPIRPRNVWPQSADL